MKKGLRKTTIHDTAQQNGPRMCLRYDPDMAKHQAECKSKETCAKISTKILQKQRQKSDDEIRNIQFKHIYTVLLKIKQLAKKKLEQNVKNGRDVSQEKFMLVLCVTRSVNNVCYWFSFHAKQADAKPRYFPEVFFLQEYL